MKKRYYIAVLMLLLTSQEIIACTIFSCARGGEIFAAANEDDYTPFTRVSYNPAGNGRYGSVYFAAPDMQLASAMNEYGLFFDFAQASYDLSKLNLTNPYKGFLVWEILGKCKTVKEALVYFKKYDYDSASQVLIADREGNSALINPKGIVEKTGDFQVNANCNLINGKISCRRPEIVNEELSKSKKISVDFLKDILNKTHQEGGLTTLYSTICDLKRGIIYVYFYHNYDVAYKIDLKAELKKGHLIENLSDYFEPSFAYENFSKNHALYLKESIFDEMNKKGLAVIVDHYITESKDSKGKDNKLDAALLEVALQLIKYSWNENHNGGMWEYFFNLPNGYQIAQFQDKRIDEAEKILEYLSVKGNSDIKLQNFIYEIIGYLNLVQGDFTKAKEFYAKAIVNPADTYNVTLVRSNEMIKNINRL